MFVFIQGNTNQQEKETKNLYVDDRHFRQSERQHAQAPEKARIQSVSQNSSTPRRGRAGGATGTDSETRYKGGSRLALGSGDRVVCAC